MTSIKIDNNLKAVAQRKNLSQLNISEISKKAPTTINGYFNGLPVPLDAMHEIAGLLDDSEFSQQMAHKSFGSMPVMESEVYHEHPHTLDFLQEKESRERKDRKEEALFILTKQDEYLTKQDKDKLTNYVNEFLDEMLIEMKLVLSILSKTNLSYMKAIKNRLPYWIAQNYVRK